MEWILQIADQTKTVEAGSVSSASDQKAVVNGAGAVAVLINRIGRFIEN